MPHITVHAIESQLAGRERALIAALTDAVVNVYGAWARPLAVVRMEGVPAGRWGTGGHADDQPPPEVRFGIRAGALQRPDGGEIARRLVAAVNDAVATALPLPEDLRAATVVTLVPESDEYVGVGGTLVSETAGSGR